MKKPSLGISTFILEKIIARSGKMLFSNSFTNRRIEFSIKDTICFLHNLFIFSSPQKDGIPFNEDVGHEPV